MKKNLNTKNEVHYVSMTTPCEIKTKETQMWLLKSVNWKINWVKSKLAQTSLNGRSENFLNGFVFNEEKNIYKFKEFRF